MNDYNHEEDENQQQEEIQSDINNDNKSSTNLDLSLDISKSKKEISLIRFADSTKPLPASPLHVSISPRSKYHTNHSHSSTLEDITNEEHQEQHQTLYNSSSLPSEAKNITTHFKNFSTTPESSPSAPSPFDHFDESHGGNNNNCTDDGSITSQPIMDLAADVKKEAQHTFKYFIVIITLHTGKQNHIQISLDLSSSVSSIIQEILEISEGEKPIQDWEYGLFIPQFKEDVRIPASEVENFKKQNHSSNSIHSEGFWLSNDSSLQSSLTLCECKSPVLFVKPRDTPREILVKVLPPIEMQLSATQPTCTDNNNNNHNSNINHTNDNSADHVTKRINSNSNDVESNSMEFNDIEFKVANIGVATMVFSTKCTVGEAVKSICRTIADYNIYKNLGNHNNNNDHNNNNNNINNNNSNDDDSISLTPCINAEDGCLTWDSYATPLDKNSLLFTNFQEQQNVKNPSEPTTDMKLHFYFHESDIPQDGTSTGTTEDSSTSTTNPSSTTDNQVAYDASLSPGEEEMVRAQLLKASEIILQQPQLLEGEKIICRLMNVVFLCPPHPKTNGTIFITNYQFIFLSTDRSSYVSKK